MKKLIYKLFLALFLQDLAEIGVDLTDPLAAAKAQEEKLQDKADGYDADADADEKEAARLLDEARGKREKADGFRDEADRKAGAIERLRGKK